MTLPIQQSFQQIHALGLVKKKFLKTRSDIVFRIEDFQYKQTKVSTSNSLQRLLGINKTKEVYQLTYIKISYWDSDKLKWAYTNLNDGSELTKYLLCFLTVYNMDGVRKQFVNKILEPLDSL